MLILMCLAPKKLHCVLTFIHKFHLYLQYEMVYLKKKKNQFWQVKLSRINLSTLTLTF